jgi:hypothetical protein
MWSGASATGLVDVGVPLLRGLAGQREHEVQVHAGEAGGPDALVGAQGLLAGVARPRASRSAGPEALDPEGDAGHARGAQDGEALPRDRGRRQLHGPLEPGPSRPGARGRPPPGARGRAGESSPGVPPPQKTVERGRASRRARPRPDRF